MHKKAVKTSVEAEQQARKLLKIANYLKMRSLRKRLKDHYGRIEEPEPPKTDKSVV